MTKYSFVLLGSETENFLKKIQELGVLDVTRSSKAIDDYSSEQLEKALKVKKSIALLNKVDYTKDADYDTVSQWAKQCGGA